MKIKITKDTEKISETDFIRLGMLLVHKRRGKPRFRCPMHAITHFREKKHMRSLEFVSRIMDIIPGTGFVPLESWLEIVSELVE